MNKYEFVPGDTIVTPSGHTIKRIRALIAIPLHDVLPGDTGGYIESEENLAQAHDSAWVSDNAQVYGHAQVRCYALVCDHAQVYGHAQVYERAQVLGHTLVCDHAQVYDRAQVRDRARVYGHAQVRGQAQVCDDAHVLGHALVYGHAQVRCYAQVYDHAQVLGMCSKTPICVSGLTWPITITDTDMDIGCQHHPVKHWAAFTDYQISAMNPKALDFWTKHKTYLLSLRNSESE